MNRIKAKNIYFYILGGAVLAAMVYLSSQSCLVEWLWSKVSGLTLVHEVNACQLIR